MHPYPSVLSQRNNRQRPSQQSQPINMPRISNQVLLSPTGPSTIQLPHLSLRNHCGRWGRKRDNKSQENGKCAVRFHLLDMSEATHTRSHQRRCRRNTWRKMTPLDKLVGLGVKFTGPQLWTKKNYKPLRIAECRGKGLPQST